MGYILAVPCGERPDSLLGRQGGSPANFGHTAPKKTATKGPPLLMLFKLVTLSCVLLSRSIPVGRSRRARLLLVPAPG
jgi:hypothetical protein